MSDSFVTPWIIAHQALLSTGFPRQEHWSGLPFPSPRNLPDPGIKVTSPVSAKGFFNHWATREALKGIQSSSIQLLSRVQLFATPWTAARQASLSTTNSRSSPKLTSIESVMPSSHLILCRPLLLLPPILPSIRVFSNESILPIRWPKYWSFSFSNFLPMNIQDWFPLGWTDWISLPSKGLSRVFSNTTVQKHQFYRIQLSL